MSIRDDGTFKSESGIILTMTGRRDDSDEAVDRMRARAHGYTEAVPLGMLSDNQTYAEPTSKKVSLVDLNLIDGTSDRLRNTLGGVFYNDFDVSGEYYVPPVFYKFLPMNNTNEYIYSVVSYTGPEVDDAISTYVAGTTTNDTEAVSARGYGAGSEYYQQTIIPSTRFVCRIEGNPTAPYLTDVLKGNKYWEKMFTGGEYEYTTVKSMYNNATYDDHYITTTLPYPNIEKQYLQRAANEKQFIAATYDYNHYLSEYQAYASSLDSELLIPNYYAMTLAAYAPLHAAHMGASSDDQIQGLLNPNIFDHYTVGGTLKHDELTNYVVPTDPVTELTPTWQVPLSAYLTGTLVQNSSKISATALEYAMQHNKNILFGRPSMLDEDNELTELAVAFPYYNKINFPTQTAGQYSSIIRTNGCAALFLRSLKEIFLGQAEEAVPITNKQFMQNEIFMSSSVATGADVKASTTATKSYKTVDLIKVLLHIHDNIQPEEEDFFVVDYNSVGTEAVYDMKSVYRSYTSRNSVRTINDILSTFGNSEHATSVSNINSILNSQNLSIDYDVDTFNYLQPESKPNEIVAYRIEKIGGPVSGDSNTQDALQNFWIFNDQSLNVLNLIDSQIKYDTTYTYKIYAYYAIKGFKYRYSDLQISKIVGQVSSEGVPGSVEAASGLADGPVDQPSGYCIEYYNPFTNERSKDLLENIPEIYGEEGSLPISSLSDESLRTAVSSKRGADERVLPPYVANFIVTSQPSLKIVEVPLMTKSYKVLDNPPNELDVAPNYVLDNSNRLHFDLVYQTFSAHPYPRPINNLDVTVEEEFLQANDFLTTTMIDKETVSPQRTVEVYRLSTKPKSFRDFSGNLLSTLSLAIEASDFSYTTAVFSDIVKSNQKYYYLFRAVNEQGIPGNVDTILEAELINDGGYKYATFEVLFEEDLQVNDFVKSSAQFKKILQLTPNLAQTEINSDNADFNRSAESQYMNVDIGTAADLIWDKTFKIRLTSKKTGKKIDLNVTYTDPTKN